MKKNIIIIILSIFIIVLSIMVITNKNKNSVDNNSNSNQSNITSNGESNSNLNSDELSNITSNTDDSNYNIDNSNIVSNDNNTSNNSNVTSNKPVSNNNKVSNSNINSNNTTSNKSSNKTSNKSNINSNNSTSNKQSTTLYTNGSFTGVYKLGDWTFTLYQISSTKIHYQFFNNKTAYSYRGNANISNKTANIIASSNYTITLTTTGVQMKSGNSLIPSDFYPKIKNYTAREYYSDNIGDLKYENSKYNGIYTGKTGKVKMFQKSATEVNILINANDTENGTVKTYSTILPIVNGSLKANTAQGYLEITFSNNTINLSTGNDSNISANSALFYATGTYTKQSKYTIEQIVSELG